MARYCFEKERVENHLAKKAAFKTRRACFLLHFYYFHVIIPLFSDDDFRQPTMVHQKCFCLFGFGHLFGLHCVFYGNKIFRRSTWTSIDSLRKGKKLKKKIKKLTAKHYLLRMQGQFGTAPFWNKFWTRLKCLKKM